jgi:ubiquinone/menaquinone biosynthesis C-methylase UbiE
VITNEQSKDILPDHHVCSVESARSFDNPIRRLFHKPEVMFAEWIRPGMTIMDLGSGLGYFSLGIARMLEGQGTVFAVDIQREMLNGLMQRATRYGLDQMIRPVLCQADDIIIHEGIDFALAFWMFHEMPDHQRSLGQVYATLNTGGRFLIVEPWFHVRETEFRRLIEIIRKTDFVIEAYPRISISRAVLLRKS